jgi:succinate dehydrogenase / fumarate reductase membrane anchor subunit
MSAGKSLRTARSVAVGLGAARHGVGHFIVERVSAMLLVPLVLWGGWSVFRLAGAGFEGAQSWIASPFNAVVLGLGLICALVHVKNAMAVVVEDYIHRFVTKSALLILNVSICVLAGALGVFAILKAALIGAL